jgi:hypothetical protein
MAPEQARSTRGGVGPAADIYALGSILYEMLTGRPPFDAANPAETITQLLHDEPLSPSRLRPRLPADLETICLKCLEKSPRRRYASAGDLAEDLRRFQAREPIRARPVGPVGRAYRWCRRRPLVAGLLALSTTLAVACVVTVVLYEIALAEARAREAELKAAAEEQEIVQLDVTIGVLEMDNGDAFAAVLRFAEAVRLDKGDDASRREHRTQVAKALRQCSRMHRMRTHEGSVFCTSLGPSGGRVASAGAGGAVEVWDVLTGAAIGSPLKHGAAPRDGAFSPDGKVLATVSATGAARVWDVESGTVREIPNRGREPIRRVAFADGGHALITQHADFAVRLWDLTAAEPVPLRDLSGGTVSYSALSDDGRWLFTFDTARGGQVWDVATGKPAGPPLKLGPAPALAAVSPDGRRLALVAADGSLRVWDASDDGWHPGPLRLRQPVSLVRFSPDGRLLVAGTGTTEARVWDAGTGQAVTPPLSNGGFPAAAALGPDGKELVTVGRGGMVCTWELPLPPKPGAEDLTPDERPVEEIIRQARALARPDQ